MLLKVFLVYINVTKILRELAFKKNTFKNSIFTFMHLADAFIQSDLYFKLSIVFFLL